MENRLPNLLIIGAMKSGTSSLHDYLNLHPDVFMSDPKEIHYYADEVNKVKSKEWYTSFFQTEKKIAGTTPQSYTKCHNKYYKNIPQRIYEETPDVKLIYIVRDPIKRYASHILESYHCDNSEDVKYSQDSDNYLKTSMYAMQLKAYLEYFHMDQIHIISLEDLQRDRLVELNKIFKFLGVNQLSDESLFNFKTNAAETKGVPTVIKRKFLIRVISKLSPILAKKITGTLSEQFYSYLLKKPIISGEEKDSLKKKLKEDVMEFRELTRKPFETWEI